MASLAGCAAIVLLAGCTAESPAAQPTPAPVATSAPVPAVTGCHPGAQMGPLPEWARAGFSGDARALHVIGAKGDILAVLFGHPLSQPPAEGRNNKILWVSRRSEGPLSDLRITARLDGSAVAVERVVAGGPGPSIIDMPEPGCWHMTLNWAGHTDTMDIVYVAG